MEKSLTAQLATQWTSTGAWKPWICGRAPKMPAINCRRWWRSLKAQSLDQPLLLFDRRPG